jgi:hypothetical protein
MMVKKRKMDTKMVLISGDHDPSFGGVLFFFYGNIINIKIGSIY